MKFVFTLLGTALGFSLPFTLFSQCAGGLPALTITYDSTIMGIGNSSNTFTFPKFDPSLGTLLSADIQSVSKLQYSYTLTNKDATISHTYKTQVVRTDDIFSAALDPSSIDASTNSSPDIATLSGGQHVDVGPSTMNYTIFNSVTDSRLVNFEGVGNLQFDYEIGTSAFTTLSTRYIFNFNTALDTVLFSITYRYCTNSLLSSDLLFFTAIPVKNKAMLNWRQATVQADRVYGVQMSTDGNNFSTLANVAESTTGVYDYTYLNGSAKKLYFRIQERNASGEIKYSNIRLVEFNQDGKSSVKVFPTLYNGGGDLQVTFPEKGNWQVNMYAADGRKVAVQRQDNAYAAAFQVPGSLGNGLYVIETFNIQSKERQVTRIIVQR